MDFLQKYLAQIELAFAGLIGALIALPFQPELKTKSSKFVFVVSGAGCAHYLTGLAVQFFNIQPGAAGSVGFLLGAFGGALIAAIMRAINESDLLVLLRGRLAGRGE